jgi:hypothetical protein
MVRGVVGAQSNPKVAELTRCEAVMLEPEVDQPGNCCHHEKRNSDKPWRLPALTNTQKIIRFRDITDSAI